MCLSMAKQIVADNGDTVYFNRRKNLLRRFLPHHQESSKVDVQDMLAALTDRDIGEPADAPERPKDRPITRPATSQSVTKLPAVGSSTPSRKSSNRPVVHDVPRSASSSTRALKDDAVKVEWIPQLDECRYGAGMGCGCPITLAWRAHAATGKQIWKNNVTGATTHSRPSTAQDPRFQLDFSRLPSRQGPRSQPQETPNIWDEQPQAAIVASDHAGTNTEQVGEGDGEAAEDNGVNGAAEAAAVPAKKARRGDPAEVMARKKALQKAGRGAWEVKYNDETDKVHGERLPG